VSQVVHSREQQLPLTFRLRRLEDETGVSGTGIVAWGTQFPDGSCAVRWNTEDASTAVWDSIEKIERVHGHEGKTVVEWLVWWTSPPLWRVESPRGDAVGSV
jgi:hypothetical protein